MDLETYVTALRAAGITTPRGDAGVVPNWWWQHVESCHRNDVPPADAAREINSYTERRGCDVYAGL